MIECVCKEKERICSFHISLNVQFSNLPLGLVFKSPVRCSIKIFLYFQFSNVSLGLVFKFSYVCSFKSVTSFNFQTCVFFNPYLPTVLLKGLGNFFLDGTFEYIFLGSHSHRFVMLALPFAFQQEVVCSNALLRQTADGKIYKKFALCHIVNGKLYLQFHL